MSTYFQDFPVVDYRFGDEETFTRFQHLGTAVDILDQVKQYEIYYENYEIQNGERPEVLSYRLYGNTDFYWTFYLLNDHLRQHGWPIRDAAVWDYVQIYYPNSVVVTPSVVQPKTPKLIDTGNSLIIQWVSDGPQVPLTVSKDFVAGGYVWFQFSKQVGKILRVDHQTGFIFTDAKNIRGTGVEPIVQVISEDDYELFKSSNGEIEPRSQMAEAQILKVYDEFDAPHHWEDVDGNWIYPTPSPVYPYGVDHDTLRGWNSTERKWYTASTKPSVNSISYGQTIVELNQRQKTISVIKRDSIEQVVAAFNRLLRQ